MTNEKRDEHTCLISGFWLHKPTSKEHRERIVQIWKKLFASSEMSGKEAQKCTVTVLVGGELECIRYDSSPKAICEDTGLAALLEKVLQSESTPAALLAGAMPIHVAEIRSPVISLIGDEFAVIHDGLIEKRGKTSSKVKSSDIQYPGTQLLLTALSSVTIECADRFAGWRDVTRRLGGCVTSIVLTNSGEFILCADKPNDLYLSCAPGLSEAVFFTSDWDTLRDYASKEDIIHMGGFFTETLQRDELLGVVLRNGQLAHGIPGIGDSSGRINWCSK